MTAYASPLEDEERGSDHDAPFTEKVHVIPATTRPSRSRSSRSSRPSQSSAHGDGEANGSPSEPPIGLRDAIQGTVRNRNRSPAKRWLARVRGKGRKKIGWKESLRAIALSSCKYCGPLSHHFTTMSLVSSRRDFLAPTTTCCSSGEMVCSRVDVEGHRLARRRRAFSEAKAESTHDDFPCDSLWRYLPWGLSVWPTLHLFLTAILWPF